MIAAGHSIEIIFVSADRDRAGYDTYRATMPWLAMPYADQVNKYSYSRSEVTEDVLSRGYLEVCLSVT